MTVGQLSGIRMMNVFMNHQPSQKIVEDSRLVQMLQAPTSLTDDERYLLVELLKKMGQEGPL
tara:strand:+ start:191 stop:376 length:186 start_codon:yes stop_codon:yes gene_type:complete